MYIEIISILSFKRTSQRTCQFENCKNEVIMLTNHCGDHILMADKEQHLIRQCCFLYNTDAGQCRVPIYDVLANVAVCKDHRDAVSFISLLGIFIMILTIVIQNFSLRFIFLIPPSQRRLKMHERNHHEPTDKIQLSSVQ